MTKKELHGQLRNSLIRNAQTALWDLEDFVLSRTEILRMTGFLQGKKDFSENE